MDIHKNARLTPLGREALAKRVLDQHLTLNSAAAEFKVSPRTAAKWVRRYQIEGPSGLADRSSRPHQLRQPTPLYLVQQVEHLRRQRWAGCRIAAHTGLSPATVSRLLRRLKLNRMRDLEPAPPILRYEHAAPGDLLHLDIKKLGRFRAPGHRIHHDQSRRTRRVGFDFVHVAVDDHSRIAFAQILPNEQALSAAAFLAAALAYYQRLDIASSASSPTTALVIAPWPSATSASNTASAIPIRDPIPHVPTARPNVSSKPLCESGPMLAPTTPRPSAPITCSPGCISTTGIVPMLA